MSSSSSSSTPATQPEPKQKKLKSEEEAEAVYKLIPSLPDDVALNCLARIPRSQHPTLSLVSRPIRSLLSSPLFFNARSLLHCTEPVFNVTIRSLNGFEWFNLFRNPNALVPVPVPPIPSPSASFYAAYAVLGSNIYVIGGLIDGIGIPSPEVWVLDCRFNRWQPGPTMPFARRGPVANVVDGKIYVMGGCEFGSTIWAEVLDPAVGRWVEMPCPFAFDALSWGWEHASAVVDDKVYVEVEGGQVAFDPRNRVWESVEKELYLGRRGRPCVVDGILYECDLCGKINALDVRQRVWNELKGLGKRFLTFEGSRVTVAYDGGRLIVVWRCPGTLEEESDIWCAEIEVNKNGDAELWGRVCWSQKILSLPQSSFVKQCLAVVL